MTQSIQLLSFEKLNGEIRYGGGAIRAFFQARPIDPLYYVTPTRPIPLPSGEEKSFLPCICDDGGCDDCLHTPCVTVPIKQPGQGHHGWIALRRDLGFGNPEISLSGPGPLLMVPDAVDVRTVWTAVKQWVPAHSAKTTFHVYALDLLPNVGTRHLVIPVAPLTSDLDCSDLFTGT